MFSNNERDTLIQEKMKKLLANPPQYTFPEEKRRELLARLYKIDEEKKTIVEFVPFKMPAFSLELVPVAVRRAATVAVTVLIAFFGYTHLFSPLYPVVSGIEGTVKVYHSAVNQWEIVERPRTRLAKNDIVKTFDDGRADVILPGAYHMRLKSDSEMKLAKASRRALSGGIQYELSKGKAFAYYKKLEGQKKTFVVDTPEATATVLGTDFLVEVMPTMDKTFVGVLDGVVKVTGRQTLHLETPETRSVFVEAGERTTVRLGQAPSQPKRIMEDELMEMEELYGLGTKPQVALLISAGKGRVRELLSVTPLYISSEKPAKLSREIEAIARSFNKAIKENAKDKIKENIRQFEEIINNYPNPKYDVQFLLFIGAYYEYINEHEKAIETFRKVVDKYPKSTLASIAQCAIGIIYEEKLNDPQNAKTSYQKVLANYPKSVEVTEAQEGLRRISMPSDII